MTRNPAKRRRGAATVEAAVVMPVFLLFVLGILIGGLGVFRHQQVAWLAREAARYASVRAGEFEGEFGRVLTTQGIVDAAVTPYAVGLEPARLTVTVEFRDRSTDALTTWDAAGKDIRSVTASGEYVSNTVRVTVTYDGVPGVFGGTFQVSSVSEMPLSN
jgi:Flp pilus assembly protein TadG